LKRQEWNTRWGGFDCCVGPDGSWKERVERGRGKGLNQGGLKKIYVLTFYFFEENFPNDLVGNECPEKLAPVSLEPGRGGRINTYGGRETNKKGGRKVRSQTTTEFSCHHREFQKKGGEILSRGWKGKGPCGAPEKDLAGDHADFSPPRLGAGKLGGG